MHPQPPRRAPVALLLPLLFSLAPFQDGAPEAEAPSTPATNVLFVTLEAARADRFGCYGHAGAHTPRIDALAASGARFERAYAHAPHTLPAHASLFTGTTPLEHGLHEDGREALGASLRLIAESFREQGYRTGAFVSAYELQSHFGLARGFEVYDDDMGPPIDMKVQKLTRNARELSRATVSWIAAERGRPFFCWVNLGDARAPWDPPHDMRALAEHPYDGELAHVDDGLGRILDAIASIDALERTLVIVVGAFGAGLGEGGETAHGALLTEGTVRVPLIVAQPGRVPEGQDSDLLVGQSDISPTLLELVGLPPLEGATGRSFAAALTEGAARPAEAPRSVYLESEYAARHFGWSTLRGLIEGGWKYVHAPAPELYELSADPAEARNRAASEAAVAERLRAALDARRRAGLARAAATVRVDLPQLERYHCIAYEPPRGTAAGELSEGSGVNPAERMAAIEHYRAALQLCREGEYFAMAAPLEEAVRASPDTASLRTLLGIVYERTRRYAEAVAELEQAIELDPASGLAYFHLARSHVSLGEADAAEPYYQLAAELAPESFQPQLSMATWLQQRQRYAEAIPYMHRAARLRPQMSVNWRNLTNLQRSAGDWHGLIRSLAEAARHHPEEIYYANYQAWALATAPDETARDPAAALAIAEELAEGTQMQDPGIIDTLAAALAASGRFDEAEQTIVKGILLAHSRKIEPLLTHMRARLALYRSEQPFVEEK